MMSVCFHTKAPDAVEAILDELPDDYTYCCHGSAMSGDPLDCTCWEPVYDLDQTAPDPTVEPSDQPEMCADCAYRSDSPERADADDSEMLGGLPDGDNPFWCHQGIRRPTRWRHPLGREVPGDPADYRPPLVAGVPYQADGQPALRCAGWVARKAVRA